MGAALPAFPGCRGSLGSFLLACPGRQGLSGGGLACISESVGGLGAVLLASPAWSGLSGDAFAYISLSVVALWNRFCLHSRLVKAIRVRFCLVCSVWGV